MELFPVPFDNLNDLVEAWEDEAVLVSRGDYDKSQPHPGPHVMIASPSINRVYDFIRTDANTYTLKIREVTET